jgi:hypothetical protein
MVWGELPLVRSPKYMSKWGASGSQWRLFQLARVLAGRADRAGWREPDCWNLHNDLSYLRRLFYETASPAWSWEWPLTLQEKERQQSKQQANTVRCGGSPSGAPSPAVHQDERRRNSRMRYLVGQLKVHWCNPSALRRLIRAVVKLGFDDIQGPHGVILQRIRERLKSLF